MEAEEIVQEAGTETVSVPVETVPEQEETVQETEVFVQENNSEIVPEEIDVTPVSEEPVPRVFRLIESNGEAVAMIMQWRGLFINEDEWKRLPKRLKSAFTDVSPLLEKYRKQNEEIDAKKAAEEAAKESNEQPNEGTTTESAGDVVEAAPTPAADNN